MTMDDRFNNNDTAAVAPARVGFEITPDDGVEFDVATRELYIGTGGDLKITLSGYHDTPGGTVTLINLPNASRLPYRVVTVHATDTTASDIVGLY